MKLNDIEKDLKPVIPKFSKRPKETDTEPSAPTKSLKKRKTGFDYVLTGLLIFFACCFIFATGKLIDYQMDVQKAEQVCADIRPTADFTVKQDEPLIFVDVNGKYVWERYLDAYENNPDFVGWISIADTPVDYPVMQTIGDNEFYLHHDINRQYSSAGTIFADEKSDMQSLTDNVILYGHHMKAGTMFASLEKYENTDYAKKHKTVILDTLNGRYTYEVIGAFRTSIGSDKFHYYDFYKDNDDFSYADYIDGLTERSYLEIPEMDEDVPLLTLSTCDYKEKNGRFVVVCRQIENTDECLHTFLSYEEYQALQQNKK